MLVKSQWHFIALVTRALLFLPLKNAKKLTSCVCVSDVYLDPNEEQVHLTINSIFFKNLQHTYEMG